MHNEFDKAKIERALVAIWHLSSGMRRTNRYPLAGSNHRRITGDAECLDELAEFTEYAMQQLTNGEGNEYHPHVTPGASKRGVESFVREVRHA